MQFDLDTATTRINSSRLMTQKELAEWKKVLGGLKIPLQIRVWILNRGASFANFGKRRWRQKKKDCKKEKGTTVVVLSLVAGLDKETIDIIMN